MASPEILTNAGLWIAGYDLQSNLNAIAISAEAQAEDVTTFGDPNRTYAVGVKRALYSGAGLLDAPAEAELQTDWGLSNLALTIAKATTINSVAFVGKVLLGQLQQSRSVNAPWTFSLNGEMCDRGFGRGRVMENQAAVTATGTGTGRQLRAISSGFKAFATLHVLSVSGTTPSLTVILESDDNSGFTSPATRATFTAATLVGGQHTSVDGPITDDYWRFKWTVSGTTPSFAFVCALGFEQPV